MTFKHKLSRRLAMLKDRRAICVAATLAAGIASCQFPLRTTDSGVSLAQLVLLPKTASLLVNQSIDFVAFGVTTVSDTVPVAVTWSATGGNISDSTGSQSMHYGQYKAGTQTGQFRVIASDPTSGKADTASVVVTATVVPVASVVVLPVSASLLVGATLQFVAVPLDAAGTALDGRVVTWASSNASVATVNGSGLATGVVTGSVTITGTSEGQRGTAALAVSNVPVASVSVSPAAVSLQTGQTAQLTATPRDASGNPLLGRVIAWSSSDSTIGKVNGTGLVTARAGGSVTITATSEGQSGTAVITVTFVPVASVTVTPASSGLQVGQTVQLTATPRDGSGNPLSGRLITWSSSDTTIAKVNGSGLVTARAAGSATVTATSEGQSGTAAITVTFVPVASVTVTPAASSLQVGQTVQLTATPRDASGNPLSGRTVTWASSNTAAATVNGSGLVTARAAGTATITATSEGKNGTATISVTAVPVASVTVTPASATVLVGQTAQLTATPRDANGNPLSGRTVTWTSSSTAAATVNGSGLVTGLAAGLATVTATSEGRSGTSAITVQGPTSGALPVFPGARGFGTTTPAGRGGAILRVTNLNDAGAGSLRAALEATGPRTVIFEVGGMIDLSDDIYITSPYLTVAGQTAPSPGITLRYAGLQIQTHDVLIQHLRIRVGDLVVPGSLGQRDCIQIQNQNTPPYNVVIDHVSLSWNTDKNMSTWYTLHDVTISHSIIAEPLWSSRSQNYNLLIGDYSTNVTVLGNLFAHADERNPYAKGATSTVVVNNLIYDPGQDATTFSDYDGSGPLTSSVVGNVMIAGPSTTDPWIVSIVSPIPSGTAVYLADDVGPALVYKSSNIGFDPVVATPPVSLAGLTILPSSQVEAWVRATAGARPADRDAVDLRFLTEEQTRTGQLRNSQTDVGGWPVLTPTARALTVPANPTGIDPATGYTNLELWLFQYAAQVEGR